MNTSIKPHLSICAKQSLIDIYANSKDQSLTEECLLDILGRPPATTVLRVNDRDSSLESLLSKCREFLDENNKNDEFEVRWHSKLPGVIVIVAQTFETNAKPSQKEVIVDAACGAAVLRGADIYVPGVLAACPGMHTGNDVSVFVDIEKACNKGLTKVFTGTKLFIGNGIAQYSRDEIFSNSGKDNPSGVAVRMNNKRFNLPSFNGLDTGSFFPQNLPSIVAGHVLDVQNGDVVLDMCAAPGGKTTHIASLLKGKGTLISIDKTARKVDRIVENLKKLDLLSSNVRCYCYDSTNIVASSTVNEPSDISQQDQRASLSKHPPSPPPYPSNSFNRILLDPPCSGLGQRPQLRYTLNKKELSSYPMLQRKLLKQNGFLDIFSSNKDFHLKFSGSVHQPIGNGYTAVTLLNPGGCLVYSTCTLRPQENEEQIAWVIKTFPDMQLTDQYPKVGRDGLPGYGLTIEQLSKVQRFDNMFVRHSSTEGNMDMNDRCDNDTIAFFIAKFVKASLTV